MCRNLTHDTPGPLPYCPNGCFYKSSPTCPLFQLPVYRCNDWCRWTAWLSLKRANSILHKAFSPNSPFTCTSLKNLPSSFASRFVSWSHDHASSNIYWMLAVRWDFSNNDLFSEKTSWTLLHFVNIEFPLDLEMNCEWKWLPEHKTPASSEWLQSVIS